MMLQLGPQETPRPHRHCFEAALQLTAQQDQYTLTRSLLHQVRRIRDCYQAHVYEICTADGSRDFSAQRASSLIFRKFSDDMEIPEETPVRGVLYQCLRDSAPVRSEDSRTGRVCTAFPVFSSTKVMRALLVESGEFDDARMQYVGNLVALYRNQLEMMDQRERDPLTGLLNRQTFDDRLMRVLASSLERTRRLGRQAQDSWLALLDIDHFKRVNDTFGHLYGDEILLLFSRLMEREFRHTDLLFRYGGEEFVVIIHGREHDDAYQALERFRMAVDSYDFPTVGHVTVSVGFTQLVPGELPTSAVDRADRALYKAKGAGRNQVLEAPQLDAPMSTDDDAVEMF